MSKRNLRRCLLPAAAVAVGCATLLSGAGRAAASAHQLAGTPVTAGIPVTAGGTWHNAQQLPGLAALGSTAADTVSCASPGNCVAAGGYTDSTGHKQPYVATQAKGKWGTTQTLPGVAALGASDASIGSVSCASAGNCAATGDYTDSAGHSQVFVAGQTDGTWGAVQALPGLATLNNAGTADAAAGVSCGAPGNCAVAGTYESTTNCPDQPTCQRVFVANEVNGVWHTAREFPGLATQAFDGLASVFSVSCPASGNCAAAGSLSGPPGSQAWVASETNGTWAKAIPVPGIGALNQEFSQADTVSCASPGNCSAGGFYQDVDEGFHAFVVTETNGIWGNAIQVPGLSTLDKHAHASLNSVSCGSPGNCSAAGSYRDGHGDVQVFVTDEVSGTWQTAIEMPGLGALNTGGGANVSSVSCGSAGNCSAGGFYEEALGSRFQAFVATQTNGSWGSAIQVPGTAQFSPASIDSMSCAAAGRCTAIGQRTGQAFVVSES